MERVVDLGQAQDVTMDEHTSAQGSVKLFRRHGQVVRVVVANTATFDQYVDPKSIEPMLTYKVAKLGNMLPGTIPEQDNFNSHYLSDRCEDFEIKLVRYTKIDERRAETTMGFKFKQLLEGPLADAIRAEGASPEDVEDAAAVAANKITLAPSYKGINVLAAADIGGVTVWLTVFIHAKTARVNIKKIGEWVRDRMCIELREIGFIDPQKKFPQGVYRSIDESVFIAAWKLSFGEPVWPEGVDSRR